MQTRCLTQLKLLDFAPMMAKFVGTGSGFIMNYALRQFVVFSREPRFASWASLACLSRPAAESCVDHELKGGAPKPMIAPQSYPGHRCLKAMQNAPHYAEAIYRMIRSALPAGTPRILDFGAGDGMFAELLLRDGLKVDCVEPDPHNQQSLASLGLSPVADIAVLEDNRYDFVYAINVLEHLHDLDRHVADLHRVLSANGRLFVFVPAFAILWTSLDDEVDHVRRFTRASLTRALGGSDLAIEECRYFDSLGFPAALCVRALEAVGAFRYSPQTVGFYDRALLPLSLFGDRMLSNILGKNVVAIARKSVFESR
jgi:SAM-dependent methyltransferase